MHGHFEELRRRINQRLGDPGVYAPYAREQTDMYPWLYGALGNPSAKVVFVCENPSRAGVDWAHKNLPHGELGIATQWSGPKPDFFRRVLCEVGLKVTEPANSGGWHCYITNVIKAMDVVRRFNTLSSVRKANLARQWAEVLSWELSEVRPRVIFCVGWKSYRATRLLQREKLISYDGPIHRIFHYSAHGSPSNVKREMRHGIRMGLRSPLADPESTAE